MEFLDNPCEKCPFRDSGNCSNNAAQCAIYFRNRVLSECDVPDSKESVFSKARGAYACRHRCFSDYSLLEGRFFDERIPNIVVDSGRTNDIVLSGLLESLWADGLYTSGCGGLRGRQKSKFSFLG